MIIIKIQKKKEKKKQPNKIKQRNERNAEAIHHNYNKLKRLLLLWENKIRENSPTQEKDLKHNSPHQ